MPDGPRRTLPGKLLLATASIAVTLLALEGFARAFLAPRAGGKERSELLQYVEHDPRLGWRKTPGARVTYERSEYIVEVAINGQGLRDRERTYAAAPRTFRILALGDSFVEGYSVPLEDTVSQVLERRLANPACAVEVLNGGTAAYSTDQELLFYLDEGAKYSPDVVALFFYYNDVFGNKERMFYRAPKPLLAFGAGEGYVITNFPVAKPAPPRAAEGPPKSRGGGSALYAWVRERFLRGAPRAYNTLASFRLWPELGGEEPDEEMKVFKTRRLQPVEEGWEQTRQILAALARSVERRGGRFVAVYVPARFEVSDRDWELTRLSYDMNERLWDRGLAARRLTQIGAAAGFPILDLTAALRREDRGVLGGPYYVYDGHWNPRGHRVAARELEAFLRGRGWLPSCATPSPRPTSARRSYRKRLPPEDALAILARETVEGHWDPPIYPALAAMIRKDGTP